MLADRIKDYADLENARNSKLLVYVTGDRPGWETQIHSDVLDFFANHLDAFNMPKKISLLLYTRGGVTLAAWSIVNLIRQFCEEYEVIVPSKAHSAGTLMCLGANSILMTKQATLGPIDPSVTTPLNPIIPGAPPDAKAPVSVEAIKGYIELARDELNIKDDNNLTEVFIKLADMVHPLVLGEVYRAKSQIQMLARRLLINQCTDEEKIQKIISFLCSDSGSHDYTINRREARDGLGLKIDKPDDSLYTLIKRIYDSIRDELQLNVPWDINQQLGNDQTANYNLRRVLIESIQSGTDVFVSEGILQRTQVQLQPGLPPQIAVEDRRLFEGWKHENP